MKRRSSAAGRLPCARRTDASTAGARLEEPLVAGDARGAVGSSALAKGVVALVVPEEFLPDDVLPGVRSIQSSHSNRRLFASVRPARRPRSGDAVVFPGPRRDRAWRG